MSDDEELDEYTRLEIVRAKAKLRRQVEDAIISWIYAAPIDDRAAGRSVHNCIRDLFAKEESLEDALRASLRKGAA
jgi:hypothetical protein